MSDDRSSEQSVGHTSDCVSGNCPGHRLVPVRSRRSSRSTGSTGTYVVDHLREDGYIRSKSSSKMDTSLLGPNDI